MSVRPHRLSRASERGFSLIELGIVIAVIAVLASVVIVGKGFINQTRVGKAAEGLATIRKAGATYTANMINASTGNEIDPLQKRSLLPTGPADASKNQWTMTGSGSTAFIVTKVMFGQLGSSWAVFMSVTAPEPTMAEDLFKMVQNDPAFVNGGATVAGNTCPAGTNLPTSTAMTVCFRL